MSDREVVLLLQEADRYDDECDKYGEAWRSRTCDPSVRGSERLESGSVVGVVEHMKDSKLLRVVGFDVTDKPVMCLVHKGDTRELNAVESVAVDPEAIPYQENLDHLMGCRVPGCDRYTSRFLSGIRICDDHEYYFYGMGSAHEYGLDTSVIRERFRDLVTDTSQGAFHRDIVEAAKDDSILCIEARDDKAKPSVRLSHIQINSQEALLFLLDRLETLSDVIQEIYLSEEELRLLFQSALRIFPDMLDEVSEWYEQYVQEVDPK